MARKRATLEASTDEALGDVPSAVELMRAPATNEDDQPPTIEKAPASIETKHAAETSQARGSIVGERMARRFAKAKGYGNIVVQPSGVIVAVDILSSARPSIVGYGWPRFIRAILRVPPLTAAQMKRQAELAAAEKGFEVREQRLVEDVTDGRWQRIVFDPETSIVFADESTWEGVLEFLRAVPSIAGRAVRPGLEELVLEVAAAKGYRFDLSAGGRGRFWDPRNARSAILADGDFAVGALRTVLGLPSLNQKERTTIAPTRDDVRPLLNHELCQICFGSGCLQCSDELV
jgi:hypothetical protein